MISQTKQGEWCITWIKHKSIKMLNFLKTSSCQTQHQEIKAPSVPVTKLPSSTGQSHHAFTFQLDPGVNRFQIHADTNSQTTPFELSLKNPNQQVVKTYKGEGNTYFVSDVQPGLWTIEVVSPDAIGIRVSVSRQIQPVTVFHVNNMTTLKQDSIGFFVDSLLTELLITASTESEVFSVTAMGPDNTILEPTVLNRGLVQYFHIKRPAAGLWNIKLNGPAKLSLNISGESTSFFAIKPTVLRKKWSFHGTFYASYKGDLVPGNKEIFSVKLADPQKGLKNLQLHLLSENGKILNSSELHRENTDEDWITVITVPTDNFRIMVMGVDWLGESYQRMHNVLYSPKQ